MVWQAICPCNKKSRCYIAKGNISAQIYIQGRIEKRLLLSIRFHRIATPFWPDIASIHYAQICVEWPKDNNVFFVLVDCNQPNCPQLRLIETY